MCVFLDALAGMHLMGCVQGPLKMRKVELVKRGQCGCKVSKTEVELRVNFRSSLLQTLCFPVLDQNTVCHIVSRV